jgi:type I restriction enzyme S subunit
MCEEGMLDRWERGTLGSVCTRLTDGSHFSPVPQKNGKPIANVKDLRDGYVDLSSCTKISDAAYRQLEAAGSLISTGDVLLSKDGTIGRVVVYEQDETIGALSSICILRPGRSIDRRYLGQALQSADFARQIANRTSGSALRRLVLHEISKLEVPIPPPHEQRRIAGILDIADETIRQTEQLIEKLQKMRHGLMDDLLTRGVDENGELRDPERHPEQFKDSLLGRIPRSWKVQTLGQLYAEPSRNGLYKQSSFHGLGPLMVQMGDIFRGEDVDFGGASRVQVSSKELHTFGLNVGDLLFARRSLVLEGAGKCSLVRRVPEPSTFESSIVRVRVDQASLLPEFAAIFLTSRSSYLVRRKFIRQVAVSGVSSADIAQFPIAVPHIEEQAQIIEAHERARQRIQDEHKQGRKLLLIKQGLLRDLLTSQFSVRHLGEGERSPANEAVTS